MKYFLTLLLLVMIGADGTAQPSTYAERLGWSKNARVVILHVDDAGMSHDSNEGVMNALDKGAASSFSVMMPCPWVPEIVKYTRSHPLHDGGLHLTLTSEWNNYRWPPLSGKPAVPGLVDAEGAMWPEAEDVVRYATADEVDREIRAQLDRALAMGFTPTHLDSHMGTLFASEAFLEKYIRLGIEKQIPVMFPGGHNSYLKEELTGKEKEALQKAGKWTDDTKQKEPAILQKAVAVGKMIWDAGLPVLDDLHKNSGDWDIPAAAKISDAALQKFYTQKYSETIGALKPGLTMVIMHCTRPSGIFEHISSSGTRRKGDMLAMMDPAFKKFLQQKGIIVTTWREVMERRNKLK
ncbi:MAG: polysaccharide deacetylase family protein [Chitinophagaceae bacterium]|nr:polysaccharide deacetylase family protein [Chitinophagaceae bacterium]